MAEISNVLTITQLNEYIKHIIDNDTFLQSVYVKGEISNFTAHKTGHLYFTLKDETSLIKSVMFAGYASKLKFMPETGMIVIVHGRVTEYLRDGTYNFYCDKMEPDGIGALYIAYEQLKRRLDAEGLFAQSRKKPLPKIPTRIGVITSPTGAAVQDIVNITKRRFKYAKIVLYPSLVQGDGAPAQLIEGVRYFNMTKSVDVIILGRGGGSFEDLWAFNNENLARMVASSQIPIISAVGHETDFTICDYAADKRAPTPSAAAELAVPDTEELLRKINNITGRMQVLLSKNIEAKKHELKRLEESRIMKNPVYMFDGKKTDLITLTQRLENAAKYYCTLKRNSLALLISKLDALNPLSVLSRGFCALFSDDGTLIKSVNDAKIDDVVNLKLKDGQIKTRIESVEKTNKLR